MSQKHTTKALRFSLVLLLQLMHIQPCQKSTRNYYIYIAQIT